jgi:carboxylesterase type B
MHTAHRSVHALTAILVRHIVQIKKALDLYPKAEYTDIAASLQTFWAGAYKPYPIKYTAEGAMAVGMLTDIWFTCSTEWIAQATASSNSFRYLLTMSATQPAIKLLGPMHSLDVPILFGTFAEYGAGFTGGWEHQSATELASSDQFMHYWLTFTRTGSPNGETANNNGTQAYPTWPASPQYLNLSASAPAAGSGWHSKHCAFWESVLLN